MYRCLRAEDRANVEKTTPLRLVLAHDTRPTGYGASACGAKSNSPYERAP
jgi:hypothetical protein